MRIVILRDWVELISLVDMNKFDETEKRKIEVDIENDFQKGLTGIKMLPYSSRGGVFLAYRYYYNLFLKD